MKLKISTYRPYGLIERDPAESTYELGDDKFPIVAHISDKRIARRIVACVNACAGIKNAAAIPGVVEACKELLYTAENADETGYVTDHGFIDMDALFLKVRTALAKLEGGEG